MKKIILLLFLITSLSFSLEITSVDPLNFGVVVAGDRDVSLTNVGVYVEGKSGKRVEIVVPETYDLNGNSMSIKVREKIIRLNNRGTGKFKLDIKLDLNNIQEHKTIKDNLSVKVRYVD